MDKNFYKIESWKHFYSQLCNLENDNNFSKAGFEFETFAKGYFLNTNLFQNVYLYSEIPSQEKQRFNLSDRDHGVDLLLIDRNNKGFGVQVKFRVNQDACVSWSKDKLSNLIAHRSLDGHILFSNASFVDKETEKQGKNFQKILYGDLIDLSKDDWTNIYDLLNHKPTKDTKFQPHDYQRTIIEEVVKGYATHNRGKLILPCGAGKTLVSLWIKEKLNPQRTLVLVPSLALLRQFKNEWLKHQNQYFDYACICSEQDIDNDAIKTSISELGFVGLGVTTNPSQIKDWFEKESLVIFSTYQSSPMIKKALKGSDKEFDLIICDEAHRTSTNKSSAFTVVHDDGYIKTKKRLYMTATPRILGQQIINKHGEEVKKYIADMSNETIYGPEFYRMSFKEAIEKNILVDYKIIAMGVTDNELQQKIKTRRFTDQNEMDLEELANQVALEKVMQKYDIHHAITFHSSVKRAKDFQEYHQHQYPNTDSYHVNGMQTTSQRQSIINEFKESEQSILTNARCLTEGVDVPSIDCVYFCDPKNSKIDIVQACGRALRLNIIRNKKLGYIVCPIYHHQDEDTDEALNRGAYSNIISVLRAMNDHDSRLEEEIQKIIYGKGSRSQTKNNLLVVTDQSPLFLDGFDFIDELQQKIFTTIVRKSLIPWSRFEQARKFVHGLKLRGQRDWENYAQGKLATNQLGITLSPKPDDIPVGPSITYKYKGWTSWGDWLGTGNISPHLRIFLDYEEARNFVHGLKLRGQRDWENYAQGKLMHNHEGMLLQPRPDNIPVSPSSSYKGKGWTSWGDWLGTGNISPSLKKFLEYVEARKFVHELKLKGRDNWRDYCNGTLTVNHLGEPLPPKPNNIPVNPSSSYKGKGWVSFGDWLGTGTIATHLKEYRSFNQARSFTHSLKLRDSFEWKDYCKNNISKNRDNEILPPKPKDIPADPYNVYKNKGWISWGDWLNTGTVAQFLKMFRSYEEARKFVHSLRLRNEAEWRKYSKHLLFRNSYGETIPPKPNDIPASPSNTYKDKGWVSWGDWLGKD